MGIITISRTHGSGGTFFAGELAKRLGYQFINRTLINSDNEKGENHTAVFDLEGEDSPSFIDRFRELMSNRNYYKVSLMASVYDYALKDNVVFVGMGAGIILSGVENLLNFRIVRLLAERVKAIAQIKNIPYDDAFDLVEKMDEDKRAFISHYFDVDADDPTLFHLILNSSSVQLGDALDIVSGYAGRFFASIDKVKSERFLRNRLLEKRSEMLLFRLGMVHSYGKVTFTASDDGVLTVKGVIGDDDDKGRLLQCLGRNPEIKKIEDHLKVGILSNLIY